MESRQALRISSLRPHTSPAVGGQWEAYGLKTAKGRAIFAFDLGDLPRRLVEAAVHGDRSGGAKDGVVW